MPPKIFYINDLKIVPLFDDNDDKDVKPSLNLNSVMVESSAYLTNLDLRTTTPNSHADFNIIHNAYANWLKLTKGLQETNKLLGKDFLTLYLLNFEYGFTDDKIFTKILDNFCTLFVDMFTEYKGINFIRKYSEGELNELEYYHIHFDFFNVVNCVYPIFEKLDQENMDYIKQCVENKGIITITAQEFDRIFSKIPAINSAFLNELLAMCVAGKPNKLKFDVVYEKCVDVDIELTSEFKYVLFNYGRFEFCAFHNNVSDSGTACLLLENYFKIKVHNFNENLFLGRQCSFRFSINKIHHEIKLHDLSLETKNSENLGKNILNRFIYLKKTIDKLRSQRLINDIETFVVD